MIDFKWFLKDNIYCHFIAVLEHGQYLSVYRSYGNFLKGINLAVHVFLLQLERRLLDPKFNGKLAKTLFLQIDGGPENTRFLALASLLVSRRVGGVEEIIVTRLPVGHTHEDIDAR